MNTIQLIGNVVNKRATFRQELKELQKDWELNYIINYMCLAETYIQITCKFKHGYETRWTLTDDANQLLDHLEHWTEWKTSSISIY